MSDFFLDPKQIINLKRDIALQIRHSPSATEFQEAGDDNVLAHRIYPAGIPTTFNLEAEDSSRNKVRPGRWIAPLIDGSSWRDSYHQTYKFNRADSNQRLRAEVKGDETIGWIASANRDSDEWLTREESVRKIISDEPDTTIRTVLQQRVDIPKCADFIVDKPIEVTGEEQLWAYKYVREKYQRQMGQVDVALSMAVYAIRGDIITGREEKAIPIWRNPVLLSLGLSATIFFGGKLVWGALSLLRMAAAKSNYRLFTAMGGIVLRSTHNPTVAQAAASAALNTVTSSRMVQKWSTWKNLWLTIGQYRKQTWERWAQSSPRWFNLVGRFRKEWGQGQLRSCGPDIPLPPLYRPLARRRALIGREYDLFLRSIDIASQDPAQAPGIVRHYYEVLRGSILRPSPSSPRWSMFRWGLNPGRPHLPTQSALHRLAFWSAGQAAWFGGIYGIVKGADWMTREEVSQRYADEHNFPTNRLGIMAMVDEKIRPYGQRLENFIRGIDNKEASDGGS